MPFEIPADIPALDDEQLAGALEAALNEAAEFDSIPDAELTDEHLERLSALADFATAARDAQTDREQAATERADKIAAARAALTKPAEDEAAEETEDEAKPEAETEMVAASAGAPKAAKGKVQVVGRTGPAKGDEVVVPGPKPVLTASADVPGFTTGGELNDLDEVGKAMIARMKGLPSQRLGGSRGTQNRYSVANINLGQIRTGDLVQGANGDDQGLLARARDAHRLSGGSLTAAGGWCAPSETLYDLCQIATTDGLLDLPTINVTRGGIRFTRGPGFDTIFNDENLGWWLTEAEVIAGPDPDTGEPIKPCIEVPCPDFEEVRLDAVGLCIKVGLLTQAAYPELVRWTIENALIAHQHKVDAALIQKIVDGSTELEVNGQFETSLDALAQIEQAANYIRQSWRMSFNAELEMLLPIWYRTVLRADLARRTGVDLVNVSDAQLESYFTSRNIRVQWLYNYQPLTGTPVATPDTVQAVIYPAGTWVKGTTDVINLDAVYDSTNLQNNTYTALFTEEGVLVANPCFDSYLLTLNTCASGRTGAADITSCAFEAATAP